MKDLMTLARSRSLMLLGLLAISAINAFAGGAGAGLEWETGLAAIRSSITGPVAFSITLVAIAACAVGLYFSGHMNEWARTALMFVLVAGIVLFAGQFVSSIYAVTGAIV